MNKKSVLGLLLFSCAVIAALFLGTVFMIRQEPDPNYNKNQQEINNDVSLSPNGEVNNIEDQSSDNIMEDEWYYPDAENVNSQDTDDGQDNNGLIDSVDLDVEEPDGTTEPNEGALNTDNSDAEEPPLGGEEGDGQDGTDLASDSNVDDQNEESITDTIGEGVIELPDMQLISDSSQVDYMNYIPDMVYDSKIEASLDIVNPTLDIKARSAILFDANTGEVLYYKDPVTPVFPASTAKLLTALLALDWCMEEEEITVGDELDLVADDSTLAILKKGQLLTIRNLLEGMLVPSGNDAAYVIAAFVGRKSLNNEEASLKLAIPEFIRLMNDKATSLGAVNSSFRTPDGYDAIGQYTTAYDMGMIGMAAADNETIIEICNKSKARNVFPDGLDVTWNNTNSLIVKESGRYYPHCLGLKTGSSTMAGRCLVSVAKKDDRVVVSVIMDSDSVGRWEDSTILLKYGIEE